MNTSVSGTRILQHLSLTAALVLLCSTAACLAAEEAGFEKVFNGKDLTGWDVPNPNPFWKAEDGVLVGENDEALKGNILYTTKKYKDFVIDLETRWNGEIDSGILFRKPQGQLQLGVSRSMKKDFTCAFYTGGKDKYPEAGQAKGLDAVFKPGEWNRVRLEAKGNHYLVWCNGKQVTDYTNDKYTGAGPIGVQIHGGLKMKVEFRNVQIKSLD